MVHILLLILKIISIILLSILVLALLILLYPITYVGKINGQLENKEIQAKIRLGWLFYLIYAGIWLEDKEIKYSIRVLGIPLTLRKKKKKEKKCKKKKLESDNNTEKQKSFKKNKKGNTKQKIDNIRKIVKNKKETTKEKFQKLCKMIKNKNKSVKSILKKIKETKDFITESSSKEAYRYGKKLVLGLIRYLSPNRVKGKVEFGFEEPYMTGKVLGYIGMACGMFNINLKKIKVCPDFEQKVFEGKIIFKGHFSLGIVLIYCLKFYFDKNINKIIKKFS